jgi:hypothetical protein
VAYLELNLELARCLWLFNIKIARERREWGSTYSRVEGEKRAVGKT